MPDPFWGMRAIPEAAAPSGTNNVSAISKVRGTGLSGTGGVSFTTAALGGTPANGNILVAVVGTSNITDPVAQMTGPTGFTNVVSAWHAPNSGVDPSCAIWWKPAGAGETGPYAWTTTTGTIIQAELMEFSKTGGGAWRPVVGGTDNGVGATGVNEATTGTQLGPVTPLNWMGLCVVGAAMQNTITTEAATGFTMQATAATSRMAAGWKTYNSNAAQSGTITWVNARRWAGCIALFEAT